jgi:hypothetical protein
MDDRTLVAELAKALAWPVSAVILALLARKPLVNLISLVQRLKFKDLELEFGQRVRDLRAVAEAQVRPAGAPPSPVLDERFLKLADASPRAVVLEAWRELEAAALAAAHRAKLPMTPQEQRSGTGLIQALRLGDLIKTDTAHIMQDLRGLRNQAAHAPEFALDRDAALNYAEVAMRIVEQLKMVRPIA